MTLTPADVRLLRDAGIDPEVDLTRLIPSLKDQLLTVESGQMQLRAQLTDAERCLAAVSKANDRQSIRITALSVLLWIVACIGVFGWVGWLT